MTQYLGFEVNSDEYKVMGLAPYGEPKYLDKLLGRVLDLKEDGSIALNLDYFNYTHGLSMINGRLNRASGAAGAQQSEALDQFHMDMAASVQHVASEVMLRLARTARKMTGRDTLCMAWGRRAELRGPMAPSIATGVSGTSTSSRPRVTLGRYRRGPRRVASGHGTTAEGDRD